jgi:L-ascorbate metabolism protein UlaG (beta-lactamase superfamily)
MGGAAGTGWGVPRRGIKRILLRYVPNATRHRRRPEATISRLGVTITWLGHSAFHLAPDNGSPFLFDPWIGNPRAPANAASLAAGAKAILLTHAHGDHAEGTATLARSSGATVLTSVEIAAYVVAQGAPEAQCIGFNIGGAASAHGLRVTLTQAMHSSSNDWAGGSPLQVGTPCGFVVEIANGPVIYNTGDTGVFGDMALIAELYRPDFMFLPIGDFYTMGARQAAKAVELVQPKWIVPQHYATFPGLPGTLEHFLDALAPAFRERVLALEPGGAVS